MPDDAHSLRCVVGIGGPQFFARFTMTDRRGENALRSTFFVRLSITALFRYISIFRRVSIGSRKKNTSKLEI